MIPNNTTPSDAFERAWCDEEQAHGSNLVKFFMPAPLRASSPQEVFCLMLVALVGEEELGRMLSKRESYQRRVRSEMEEYWKTGRMYYRGAE